MTIQFNKSNIPTLPEANGHASQREIQFRDLLDLLPAAIYTTDAVGRVTYFNPACIAFSGRTPQLGSDHWCVTWKLYKPDGTPLPHCQCPMALALKEKRAVRGAEAIAERPDGSRIWFEPHPTPLFDDRGELIGGINMLVDITERKRTDEALRGSQSELDDFFENANVGLHFVDGNGIIIRANHAELEMLGYRRDEYVGQHISKFHVDQNVIADILARLARGEKLHEYRAQMLCKNGSIRDVGINSSARFQNGQFMHTRCFTRDITEQRKAEVAQSHLAAIVESSEDAIISKNFDGIITSWNKSAERLYGYTAEEAIGRMITLLIPSDRLAEESRIISRLRRGERIEQYETVRKCKDGSLVDVSLTISPIKDARGTVVGASKTVRDITERRRMEQNLKRRAQQQHAVAQIGEYALTHDLQAVFDFATSLVAKTLEVEYCKVLELLPGGKEVFLRSGVGWRPGLVGHATVDTGMNSQAGFTLASDKPVIVVDLREEKRFNGPTLLVEHKVVSGMSCIIRQPGGIVWGVLGTHSRRRIEFTEDDIAFLVSVANVLGSAVDRKVSEERLKLALERRTQELTLSHQRLTASERFAAVGTLAAGLAHDMSNLVLPLSMRVDCLLAHSDVVPQVRNEIVLISALLDHLRDLSKNLALFSRDPEQEGIVGLTDLGQWFQAVHKLLNASVGSRIIVDWDCPNGMPKVAIAPHRLTQVVQNLIHNARDAVLAVSTRGHVPRIKVQARPVPNDDSNPWGVCIRVGDNGVGMDGATKQRCIEPFFTTRDRPKEHGGAGSGLGLSLAHQIIQRAGGSMEIESEVGKGTTVAIMLPIA